MPRQSANSVRVKPRNNPNAPCVQEGTIPLQNYLDEVEARATKWKSEYPNGIQTHFGTRWFVEDWTKSMVEPSEEWEAWWPKQADWVQKGWIKRVREGETVDIYNVAFPGFEMAFATYCRCPKRNDSLWLQDLFMKDIVKNAKEEQKKTVELTSKAAISVASDDTLEKLMKLGSRHKYRFNPSGRVNTLVNFVRDVESKLSEDAARSCLALLKSCVTIVSKAQANGCKDAMLVWIVPTLTSFAQAAGTELEELQIRHWQDGRAKGGRNTKKIANPATLSDDEDTEGISRDRNQGRGRQFIATARKSSTHYGHPTTVQPPVTISHPARANLNDIVRRYQVYPSRSHQSAELEARKRLQDLFESKSNHIGWLFQYLLKVRQEQLPNPYVFPRSAEELSDLWKISLALHGSESLASDSFSPDFYHYSLFLRGKIRIDGSSSL